MKNLKNILAILLFALTIIFLGCESKFKWIKNDVTTRILGIWELQMIYQRNNIAHSPLKKYIYEFYENGDFIAINGNIIYSSKWIYENDTLKIEGKNDYYDIRFTSEDNYSMLMTFKNSDLNENIIIISTPKNSNELIYKFIKQ